MAKRKYPSELNTRTVRVNIGDWHWLNSLSQELGITVAEAFHKVVMRQEPEPKPEPKPEPMPVTVAKSTPITSIRRRSTPVIISVSREVKNVNGHR